MNSIKNYKNYFFIIFLSLYIKSCETPYSKSKEYKIIPYDTVIDSNLTMKHLQNKFKSFYSKKDSLTNTLFLKQWQHQTLISVSYYGFDGKIHKGQLICHTLVQDDVKAIFQELFAIKFPIYSVIPISEFQFDDLLSMRANNTTCFDYRLKVMKNGLSKHVTGMAIDINPMQNPYIHKYRTEPFPNQSGVAKGRIRITDENEKKAIEIFKKYGWKWGGNWRNSKDYMHFEK